MKIVYIKDILNSKVEFENGCKSYRKIDLKDRDDTDLILKAANYSTETLEKWFNTIGIKHEKVVIADTIFYYFVNGKMLFPWDLSHGERTLLLLIALKVFNKKVVMHGVYERLDKEHADVCNDIVKDYENLVLIFYSMYAPRQFDSNVVTEGVI